MGVKPFYTTNITKGNEITRLLRLEDPVLRQRVAADMELIKELRALTDAGGSHTSMKKRPGDVGEHAPMKVIARLPDAIVPILHNLDPDFLKDKKQLWKTIREFEGIQAYSRPEGRG